MKAKQDSTNQKKGLLRNTHRQLTLPGGVCDGVKVQCWISTNSLDDRVKEHHQAWFLLKDKGETGTWV